MRKTIFCWTALLALACASCDNNKNIYPVSGKVMHNHVPAAGAAVFFCRKGGDTMNDQRIMGIVQEDGSFELVCGSLGKGAPPGEYDVLIEWKNVAAQRKGSPQRGPDRFSGRYADAKNPLLHASVLAKANVLTAFELTD